MSTQNLQLKALDLQERDLAILRGLFESRVMTAAHIAALYFGGSKEAAKKRLQKLKAARLLDESERRVNEAATLFLTRNSFAVLRQQGVLAQYPRISQSTLEKRARVSPLTLRHELEVMDVKAAFHSAIEKTSQFRITEFSTWPLLYQFEASRSGYGGTAVVVKSDGLIRIHETEEGSKGYEHAFFLEVDRSTETQDTLVTRAGCYYNYYKSGGFAERNGKPRTEFRDFPFRVLMVFKNAERRNNTAERLLQSNPPIYTMACLTTFEEVTRDPLGPIWITPSDYKNVTIGTPFDPQRSRPSLGYKRQTAREAFVEERVKKRVLLS